jgi:hypothetical protein
VRLAEPSAPVSVVQADFVASLKRLGDATGFVVIRNIRLPIDSKELAMRAFKILCIAFAVIALAHPAMAQADPHHPAQTEAPDTKMAPAENLPDPSPDGSGRPMMGSPMMGCSDMMGMMDMMKMMQSMQTMQMEMMQQMLEMQKSLAASPHEEPTP